MRKNLLALVLVFSFVLPYSLAAQTATKKGSDAMKAAENITAKQMSDYLYFIASDEMEGRDTPSRGLDTTAKFIGMNLSRWGFKPAGDNGTYYQKISIRQDKPDVSKTSLEVNGQKLQYDTDFTRLAGNGSVNNAPLVYGGDGWFIKSKGIDSLKDVDVKDKIVVFSNFGNIQGKWIIRLPSGANLGDLNGKEGEDWMSPYENAKRKGAVGIIVAMKENYNWIRGGLLNGRLTVERLQKDSFEDALPTVVVSQKTGTTLFEGEKANPYIQNTSPVAPFELSKDKMVSLSSGGSYNTKPTQNVVAIWEGSDPILKNEMVAVGAHYDHLGMNPNAPTADKIWNGADDDGSGTTAILSMAEALAKSPKRPKRSILFVWHCGEEKGLWGSQYFTTYPTVDLKNVIAQLNIDMIGRSKKADDANPKDKDLTSENAIYVIGSQMMSSQLGKTVADVNNSFLKLNYDLRYDDPKDPNRFFFRSDHFNYAQRGIPITFWFDGVHVDYHQPGDEPQKIDYNKMQNVTRTIFLTMWELADTKDRPKVDKQLPPELTQR
ncbi:MAG: M28 family peptidase [Pyrinomonadaceae bacterium]